MEDPEREIKEVVRLVTAASTPEEQRDAVNKYFAPDAGFRHPLCAVSSGPNSRDAILGILQWYRVMSPHIKIEVRNVTYNTSTRELFVEVIQEFHIRWNPLPAVPSRLLVHIVLKPTESNDRVFQIALQEDFYHPGDVVALVVPPLVPAVALLHQVGTVASTVNARLFSLLGFWYPKNGKAAEGNANAHSGSSGAPSYASVAASGSNKAKED